MTELEEWADRAARAAESIYGEELSSGALVLTVAGTPEGEISLGWRADSGAVTVTDANDANADVAVSMKYPDFVKLLSAELPPAVAYMQGRLKPSGDMASVLHLLSLTADDRFDRWREQATAGS